MRFALTTFDNPYDPFEQFTQWFMFDEEKVITQLLTLVESLEHQISYRMKRTTRK